MPLLPNLSGLWVLSINNGSSRGWRWHSGCLALCVANTHHDISPVRAILNVPALALDGKWPRLICGDRQTNLMYRAWLDASGRAERADKLEVAVVADARDCEQYADFVEGQVGSGPWVA